VTAPGTSRLLALFVSSLPDGAIQQVFVNLANGFVERGHRVRLVAAKFEGERPPDLDGRVSTVNLSARATRTPWVRRRRRRWLPASAPELADFLRRERPDCLLCGGKYANLAGLWARRMAGIPLRVALSEHNPITNTVSNPGRLRVFLPFLVRRFYPLADAVVAVSASVAADLADFARIPRERVTTIPNPVLTRALLERMSEAPERPEWLGAGAPLIVTAARSPEGPGNAAAGVRAAAGSP
jgi:glycosyltransferase involved in cell wall biosynthesis